MTTPLRTTFARLCRDTRMMLDITQATLADAVGVSRSHIAGLETGRVNPSLDLVWRIADRLGIDLDLNARPSLVISDRGGDLVHARCSSYVDDRLRSAGWITRPEVELARDHGHGWIDLLAFEPRSRTLVIVEIKTRLDDLGALERQLGWYERHAGDVARSLGWRPTRTLTWLVVLASTEVEDALRLHRAVLGRTFPTRAPQMRAIVLDGRAPASRRGIALIDPKSRRRDWLMTSRSDGRRSAAPYMDYADAVRRLIA